MLHTHNYFITLTAIKATKRHCLCSLLFVVLLMRYKPLWIAAFFTILFHSSLLDAYCFQVLRQTFLHRTKCHSTFPLLCFVVSLSHCFLMHNFLRLYFLAFFQVSNQQCSINLTSRRYLLAVVIHFSKFNFGDNLSFVLQIEIYSRSQDLQCGLS